MKRRCWILMVLVSAMASAAPSPGPATELEQATALSLQSMDLYRKGQYAAATPLAERALAIREKALGPEHPRVLVSLNNVALLYEAMGQYQRAEPLLQRTVNSKAQAPDADLAMSLDNLATLYFRMGRYRQAESLARRANALFEKALGSDHVDTIICSINLAQILQALGEYGSAETLMKRGLALSETAKPARPLDVAAILHNLAALHKDQEQYQRAEPLLARALAIHERELGPEHPQVAGDVAHLALLAQSKGEYPRAESLYERALELRRKVLGPDHPAVARTLCNLGELYEEMGQYGKARELLRRALEMEEKVFGPEHDLVALDLNDLAAIEQRLGQYARAQALMERSLAIAEKALGPNHPGVATKVMNLAALHRTRGELSKAEALLERALAISETALGSSSPSVAENLNALGLVLLDQGRDELAEPLIRRALAINEQAFGADHLRVALTLHNLAGLFQDRGQPERSEPLLKRALAIREKTLGPNHVEVAGTLETLAAAYQAQAKYAPAGEQLARALGIRERRLGLVHRDLALTLGSLGRLHLQQKQYPRAEAFYRRALAIEEKTLGREHPHVAVLLNELALVRANDGAKDEALTLLVRAADIEERRLQSELPNGIDEQQRAVMRLSRAQADAAVSFLARAAPTDPEALQLAFLTALRRKGRVLDEAMVSMSRVRSHLLPSLRELLDTLMSGRAELTARIYDGRNPREADLKAISSLREKVDSLDKQLSAQSLEFRTQSEAVTLPKVQALIPAGAALVEMVRYHRGADVGKPAYVAYLLTATGAPRWVDLGEAAPIDAGVDAVRAVLTRADSAPRGFLRALDERVMAPIRKVLGPTPHLIVSPDGKLNLIPFEALVDEKGQFLVEHTTFTYVTSGRDLLRLGVARASRSEPMVIAAPDYGKGTRFSPLPGALVEAKELHDRYPTAKVFPGKEATKQLLLGVKAPRFLHLATHGCFGTKCVATAAPPMKARVRGLEVGSSLQSVPTEVESSPLDLAGLALAGANQRPESILSARELTGLDLWGTKLVVLSACESGLGDLADGEGVFGLRRALVIAGAESQVVSLWNVSDSAAPMLMRAYYEELAAGQGRSEALRRAQLRVFRTAGYAHPYYWAPFIPAGDWRRLDDTQ